jgi:hypothetical protein
MFRGSIEARTETDTPTGGIVDLTNWCLFHDVHQF